MVEIDETQIKESKGLTWHYMVHLEESLNLSQERLAHRNKD